MGQEIKRTRFYADDFERFSARLAEETSALRAFARAGGFADARYVAGFELEAWLLDHAGRPSPANDAYLRALDDPLVVPELSRFNVELNAPPVEMGAGVLAAMEESLLTTWDKCQHVAHGMDTVLAMIGILPTIRDEDLCLANMSAMNRFDVLNAQVLQQRQGAPIRIDIEGADQLHLCRPDVMLEAATTSFQLHLQVPFAQSGRYYNASLVSCAPLLAAAVNSPLLFGQRLWQETRIPLFEQAVELGGYNGLAEPSVRRVTFGRDYVAGSPLELFDENIEHYPVLLPMAQTESPARFPHLRLHNGAIWRWVRPLVGFDAAGQAHVRLEQRVLPSGPTVLDMVANAALYFGLVHALAQQPQAVEANLAFADARANFYAAARQGLQAELIWLDGRRYPVREFILEVGLPLARQGLRDFGLSAAEIEHYLGVVEARVRSGQTGAAWQLQRFAQAGGDAHRMMVDYLDNQRSGAPVHEWTL
jgi:gamma-glutamyl:cysteine ligase YbdK (ATP-grasp superfamily)